MNTAEQQLITVNAAITANDAEAIDREWREFVRILWHPMRDTVPWDKPQVGALP